MISASLLADTYDLCYSVTGTSWMKQTASATRVRVVAAAVDTVTSIAPSAISLGFAATFSLVGGSSLATVANAYFAFAISGYCNTASFRNGTVAYTTANTITVPLNGFTAAGTYKLCLSYDNGASFVEMTASAATIAVQDANADMTNGLVNPRIFANTAGQSITFSPGMKIAATPQTYVAFAPSGGCGNPGLREAPTLFSSPLTLSAPLSSSTNYSVCISTDNLATFVAQNFAGSSLYVSAITPPTATSLAALTPSAFGSGQSMSFSLSGFAQVDGAYLSFASTGLCNIPALRKGYVTLNRPGPYSATAPACTAAQCTFSLCYSVDLAGSGQVGTIYVEQTSVLLTVVGASTSAVTSVLPASFVINTKPILTLVGAIATPSTRSMKASSDPSTTSSPPSPPLASRWSR